MKNLIFPKGTEVGVIFSRMKKVIEHRFIVDEDWSDEVKRSLLMNIDYQNSKDLSDMENKQGLVDFENASIVEIQDASIEEFSSEVVQGTIVYQGEEYQFSLEKK